jgi:uncharacterized protein (TIGR02118 family)
MLKLVFCARRLPQLSRAEFQRYWRETHGPLVRRHAAVLRIRRYVQVHTLDTPLNAALQASRGGPEEFDGVAELCWDDIEDLQAGVGSPEGRAAGEELLADERCFIDLPRSPLWVGREHVMVGG